MIIMNAFSKWENFFQLIGVLLVFLFVLAITYFTTRWIAQYQQGVMKSRNIQVVEAFRVNNTKFIQIMRVGTKYLVISVCKDTINVLAELTEEERERLRQNVINNAVPAAVEWHKSEEGIKWHKNHGRKQFERRSPVKYNCTYCGKEFETLGLYGETENKFCSNACKSAYRRKTKVDDVERICEFCGKPFRTNKYSKGKYCSLSCGKKAYWKNKR